MSWHIESKSKMVRLQLFSELRWIYHGVQIVGQRVPCGGTGV